jgi:hypothetical protein
MRSLAVVLVLVAAACAPPEKTDKKTAEVDPVRWAALVDSLSAAVANNATNCGQMAKDVKAVLESNAALIKSANGALGDGFTLPDDAKARIAAAVDRMLPGIDACGAEPDVQKAFKLAKGDAS